MKISTTSAAAIPTTTIPAAGTSTMETPAAAPAASVLKIQVQHVMENSARLGIRLVGSHDYARAAAVFDFLRRLAPRRAFFHRAYGICAERIGDLQRAGEALDVALRLDSADAFARVARASVRMKCGDHAGCRADLKAARQTATPIPAALRGRLNEVSRMATLYL